MNTAICAAIAARAVIGFEYEGGHRVVEPHCHGISKPGNEVLRGYQVDGFSKSGRVPPWRLFIVGKMGPIIQTGQIFTQSRPGYNPDDSDMTTVHCHV